MQVAYAVTYNKSQGKTLRRAVVDARVPVFAHGQLYVALSRVRTREDILVLVGPEQVRRHVASDRTYLSITNVVERRMLLDTMSANAATAFGVDYPERPNVTAAEAPRGVDVAPYAYPDEVAAALQPAGHTSGDA